MRVSQKVKDHLSLKLVSEGYLFNANFSELELIQIATNSRRGRETAGYLPARGVKVYTPTSEYQRLLANQKRQKIAKTTD